MTFGQPGFLYLLILLFPLLLLFYWLSGRWVPFVVGWMMCLQRTRAL